MPASEACGRGDTSDQSRTVRAFADLIEEQAALVSDDPGDYLEIRLGAEYALNLCMAMRAVLAARGNS